MTTICAVTKNGQSAMAGDGQVTMGQSVIMKGSAKKIRRLYNNEVIVGFAGGVADAITLEERFEEKLVQYKGNLQRAAIELAKMWRGDRALQKLEALLIVMNDKQMLLVSGTGEVIEPDDGVLTIGSGGNYALAAARGLMRTENHLSAKEIAYESLKIASEIDVFTNDNILVEIIGE
ncbi:MULTISPECIES: HslVU peptidase proteolytic subunit [unclassified Granulicatella]|uniref:HslVU peptidase proteolytic subunit n=1 Tax=unclassified Granulicatella TaxID=2630493 RepID=UPI0010732FC0|nr:MULTISPECIES: HslU--HslV peptidase proteolytic subunit [unclassified Granulicatella]MBF0779984.1 HslU--HslV peptidase proteolytic subunit [Granulicatella sp. 19428wC4_WM01]TFU95910.1 HslU--HslV peptidase proteolytic subunit [Granulicatella sp. WM01]